MRKFVEWNVHERKQPSTENCSLYSLSNVIRPVRANTAWRRESCDIWARVEKKNIIQTNERSKRKSVYTVSHVNAF